MVKGHIYQVSIKRYGGYRTTYLAKYLGSDPGRDSIEVFWWLDQEMKLSIHQVIIESSEEISTAHPALDK